MVAKAAGAVLRSRIVWLGTTVLVVICALFVGLLASAWWNPAERMGRVGVAIVNEDEGCTVPAGPQAGVKLQLGGTVVKSLTGVKVDGEPILDWRVVGTRSEALEKLGRGDAVAAIVIPREFSARVVALRAALSASAAGIKGAASASPQAAAIEVISDQSNAVFETTATNAMAQQFVQRASDTVSATLVQQLRMSGGAAAAASQKAAASAGADGPSNLGRLAAAAKRQTPDELSRVAAHPVKTTMTTINPVDRYGKSIGLVFFMLFVAVGGMALTVLGFVATAELPTSRYPVALWLGRWLGLIAPAAVFGLLVVACLDFLGFSMVSPGATYGIAVLGAIAFMSFNTMLGAAFGRVALPLAVIFVPLQVAAGGAMMGPELMPGFYRVVSGLIPYTPTIEGIRSGMFGGAVGGSAGALTILIAAYLALALALCFLPQLFNRERSIVAAEP